MQNLTHKSDGYLIVTGGSRGIGKSTALLAAQHGYNVVISYSSADDAANEVVDAARGFEGQVLVYKGNVSKESDVTGLFDFAQSKFNLPLTGLINNAGITGGFSRMENLSPDVLRNVLAVNVEGAVFCSQQAIKHMSLKNGGKGGSIVNISSRASVIGGAGEWIHYALSKGAMDTLTIGLAREIAEDGIRVNAVAPGLIETELHALAGAPKRATELSKNLPMKRPGEALEVAEAVLWLLSPAASYVTGAILPVSGGR